MPFWITTSVISFPHLVLLSIKSIFPLPEIVSTVPSSDHVQLLLVLLAIVAYAFSSDVASELISTVIVADVYSSDVVSELDFSIDLLQLQRTVNRIQDNENSKTFFMKILYIYILLKQFGVLLYIYNIFLKDLQYNKKKKRLFNVKNAKRNSAF